MHVHAANQDEMQSSSYTLDVRDSQHDIDLVSFSTGSTDLVTRETLPAAIVSGYPTIQLHEFEWEPSRRYCPETTLQELELPLLADQDQFDQNTPLAADESRSGARCSSTTMHFSHSPASLYSPSSVKSCPRISSRNNMALPPESYIPQIPYTMATESDVHAHIPGSYGSTSARYLQPSDQNFAFSFSTRGELSQKFYIDRDASPGHLSSQFASIPLFYSGNSVRRPLRRRRLSPLSRDSSGSSQAGSSSDAISGCRRKRPTPSQNRISWKSRSRGTEDESLLHGSCAFSTFSISLETSDYEPAGATYMLIVDFKAETESQFFEHGPTDLPPRQYIGGPEASSPWKPRKNLGTIPGTALDYLPIVEERLAWLEFALEQYLKYRGRLAVQNSLLPGMNLDA
ncbi:hypothetical protein A7U60_g4888 [Sanghuangporus baumii]|uniref:Uncharacterized protein n=1 Tax=Sanghuangporus baumii TaxID=108892 RepID=A0A9Q5N4D5_SANBA|nr:hypothetical protein A7U60_g4888 [Sanghuangporus baumii]